MNDLCDKYGHIWISGTMIVIEPDVAFVAKINKVECERCEHVYDPKTDIHDDM